MKSENINLLHWGIFNKYKVQAGVTTRLGGYSKTPYTSFNLATHTGDSPDLVLKNRELLTNLTGTDINNYTHGKQVHSDYIHIVTNDNVGLNTIECDAIITDSTEAQINIFVADCVPIVLYDKKLNVGGVAHCGWKGTYKRLLEKTVDSLKHNFNSRTEDIIIGIGAAIGSCCYNVSEDLYTQFDPKNGEGHIKNDQFYLDLKEINKNQALNIGIDKKNIEVMNECTSCRNNIFFSYRVEGESSGRFSCYLKLLPK